MPRPTRGSGGEAEERERLAAAVLDAWPWELGAVVIGGYAVAAHGTARASVDLDFVISRGSLDAHAAHLEGQGFKGSTLRLPGARKASTSVERWRSGLVTVDLMVGGVRDVRAEVEVPCAWIASKPWRGRLLLQDAATTTEVTVCRPSALFALKLVAGRSQDLGDLFTMDGSAIDEGEIRALLSSVMSEALAAKLEENERALASRETLEKICALLGAGPPSRSDNAARWRTLKARVAACRPR